MCRLRLRERRLGLRQRGDKRLLVDHEEQVAALDAGAVLEALALEQTVDARANFDGVHRFGLPDVFLEHRNGLGDRFHHTDFGRGRRLRRSLAAAAGQCQRGQYCHCNCACFQQFAAQFMQIIIWTHKISP